jgi:hypothetical protein
VPIEDRVPQLFERLMKLVRNDLDAGERVGGYEILSRLGAGGMGIVYRARHVALGRTVALKVLAPRLATPEFERRFEREARALAAIDHPNVVRVFDAGRDGEHLFIAMELVDGRSLERVIDEAPIEPARLLPLIRDVAHGLACIHEAGLVHRDVKPSNVLVGDDGVARLTDFGLAIEAEPLSRITQTGEFLGTPHYDAPEQIQGRAVDHRSDLYALGVVLFQALTGRLPFTAPHGAALIAKHLQEPPPLDAVPLAWRDVVARLLAKDPDARYPDARALLRDLGRPRRRRWRLASALAILLLVACAALTLRALNATRPAVNVLALVDPVDDAVVGAWTMDGAALDVTRASSHARLQIPLVVPDELDWIVTARRLEGRDGLVLGFPFGRAVAIASVDDNEARSGLGYCDGRNVGSRDGDVWSSEKDVTLLLRVRRGGASLIVDGRSFIEWTGDRAREAHDPRLTTWDRRRPFLATHVRFRITRMEIVPISGPGEAVPRTPVGETGAAQPAMDLLEGVDLDRDTLGGEWRRASGSLEAVRERTIATLRSPWQPPAEYDLSLVIEEVDEGVGFMVGLPLLGLSAGTLVIHDGHNDVFSSGLFLDGRHARNNVSTVPGRLFPSHARARIDCRVRRRGIAVDVDGRTVIDWRGQLRRFALARGGGPPPDQLSIRAWNGRYRVHAWTVTPYVDPCTSVATEPPPAEGAPGPEPGTSLDLLKRVELPRDAIDGSWVLDERGLSLARTKSGARVQLRYAPPEEYDVAVAVEYVDGAQGFYVGLPCGPARTAAAFNNWPGRGCPSGLSVLDMALPFENESGVPGRAVPAEGTHDLLLSVRRNSIAARIDGRVVFEWSGNARRLGVELRLDVPHPRTLFLALDDARYVFRRVTVTPRSGRGVLLP